MNLVIEDEKTDMKIRIESIGQSQVGDIDFSTLDFGKTFTDHMLVCHYQKGQWQDVLIEPLGNLSIPPSLSALHYGQSVFEGVKAFSYRDGQVNVFRLPEHVTRLNRSLERMCMPTLPEKEVMKCIASFVNLDRAWVPQEPESALYLRPFVFATDPFLGLRPSENYTFMVIASPVGSYYKNCLENPVKLLSSGGDYVRAVAGGTGEAKTCGNYAASMLPAQLAQEQGYDQILWLDGQEGRYVDEVGTMNIFFVINDTLVTPPLKGAVLDGITRRSVIALSKDFGLAVKERLISIDEILDGADSGVLQESFGTGTAAVLSPVGEIHHHDRTVLINQGKTGPWAKRFREAIMSIQYGQVEDIYSWNYLV